MPWTPDPKDEPQPDIDALEKAWKDATDSGTRQLILALLSEIRTLRLENLLLRETGNDMAYAHQEHFEDAFKRWRVSLCSIPHRKLPDP